jgi:hypothetical protein
MNSTIHEVTRYYSGQNAPWSLSIWTIGRVSTYKELIIAYAATGDERLPDSVGSWALIRIRIPHIFNPDTPAYASAQVESNRHAVTTSAGL